MRSGRCSLGISVSLRWLASVVSGSSSSLGCCLSWVMLLWGSRGLQQQSELQEESKHTAYYWKYSGLTVQRYRPHLMNRLLTYWIRCLCSSIKSELYTRFLLRSLKGPQIIQIIVKSFKWDQKDVNLFLKRRASAKCHAGVQGRRRQICSKKCNWIFIVRPLQKGLQYF